jgi:hypothetical protein
MSTTPESTRHKPLRMERTIPCAPVAGTAGEPVTAVGLVIWDADGDGDGVATLLGDATASTAGAGVVARAAGCTQVETGGLAYVPPLLPPLTTATLTRHISAVSFSAFDTRARKPVVMLFPGASELISQLKLRLVVS